MIWHPLFSFECTWEIWDNTQKSRFAVNCHPNGLHQIMNHFCNATQKLRDIGSKYARTQKPYLLL